MQLNQSPKKRALSIGSVMIDIITVIADENIALMTLSNSTSSFLMIEQGRKVESESIATYVGGGAANTSVCMSRLGLDVEILGLVGQDINAEKIKARLEDEHIGLSHLITTEEAGSGIAVHISSHDHNAAIFTHRGANCCLTSPQVNNVAFTDYDLIYVTNLSNESVEQFPLIIDKAHEAGCFIASNPGIRQLTNKSQDFLSSLKSISLLSINTVECAALIPHLISANRPADIAASPLGEDLPPLLKKGFKIAGFSLDLTSCLKILSAHGPEYVVITDGSKGAYLFHKDVLYYCPPQETKMQGSAGAGDCFSSTLASLICSQNRPEVALLSAALNAASVISFVDTQTGLMSDRALSKLLAEKDIKTEIKIWDIS